MIQAVIFDMDGLMFDTERIAYDGYQKASDEMGFPFSIDFYKQMCGLSSSKGRELFNQWYNGSFDYHKAEGICFAYMNSYLTTNPVPLKKGLMELLIYLKDNSYPTAIATSTSRQDALKLWQSSGVHDYFKESVCGDEVQNGKPDPEIFLTAAKKLQKDPSECLVLEDSYNGIRSAYASGAFACMVPDMCEPIPEITQLCSYICDDLLQVIDILKREAIR